MRRVLLVFSALALAACGFALDGYSGGPLPSPDGGGIEAGTTTADGGDGGTSSDDAPMLVYASSANTTHIRRWNGAAWSDPIDGPTVADPIRGVTVRRSSVNGHRSLAIYTIDTPQKHGALFVYDWDGSKFAQAWTSTDYTSAGGSPGWAPFDLAFDGKTGRGLAVYGGSADGNLKLRTFDGTKWTDETTAFPKAPNTEAYQFVQLVTRPGTDDIALLWTDQGSNFFATPWLADHFGSPQFLEADIANNTQKIFDGAFESTTGDLLVVWASKDQNVYYTVAKSGAQEVPVKVGRVPGLLVIGRVSLAAQPGSDRVALTALQQYCGMKDCNDFSGLMWTGTAFDAISTINGDITTGYDDLEADAPSTVAWADQQAIALYHTDSNGFRWGNWKSGAWASQPEYSPATTIGGKASFVPFHIGSALYVLVEDRKGILWNVAFDGTAWHDADGNAPLATDLPIPTDDNGVTFSTDSP